MKTNTIIATFILILIVIEMVRIVTNQPKTTNICTFRPDFSVQYSQEMSIGDDMFFNDNHYKIERINFGITSEYENYKTYVYPTLDISLQGTKPIKEDK